MSAPRCRSIEILRVLYDDVLRYRPQEPKWPGRDRCILSKGHGCLALYAVLADKGFFPLAELDTFCRRDSILGGHPEHGKVPGVEASTGALGHGLSIGVGMALAARMQRPRQPRVRGHGRRRDQRGIGVGGGAVRRQAPARQPRRRSSTTTRSSRPAPPREIQDLEPLADKWRAFGFAVAEVDGHDVAQLRDRVRRACRSTATSRRRSSAIPSRARACRSPRTTRIGTTSPRSRRELSRAALCRAGAAPMRDDLRQHGLRAGQAATSASCSSAPTSAPDLLAGMKKEYPDRYYMEGVTEANVIGMAAGMAMEGFVPYVNTIATFITRRCYEQVAVDLCLHNLPVRLIANGGGFVYAPLGPTHWRSRTSRSCGRCRT